MAFVDDLVHHGQRDQHHQPQDGHQDHAQRDGIKNGFEVVPNAHDRILMSLVASVQPKPPHKNENGQCGAPHEEQHDQQA